jgi:hypothetical protein
LRLLLDEMYSPALASALRDAGIDAVTVAELGLAGRPDPDMLAAAVAADRAVLTENTADFTRIGTEHLEAGRHHPGILIALSSRFSRRPSGPCWRRSPHGTLLGQRRAIHATCYIA